MNIGSAVAALIGGFAAGWIYQVSIVDGRVEELVQKRLAFEKHKLELVHECEILFLSSTVAEGVEYNNFLFEKGRSGNRAGEALCSDFALNNMIPERMEHMESMRKYAREAYTRTVLEKRARTELENTRRELDVLDKISNDIEAKGGVITNEHRKRIAESSARMGYKTDYSAGYFNQEEKTEKGQ